MVDFCSRVPAVSDPPFQTTIDDEFEAAEAERASLELKGQIARARRVLDHARLVLGQDGTSGEDESARP
jgi:tellurite resistance protein